MTEAADQPAPVATAAPQDVAKGVKAKDFAVKEELAAVAEPQDEPAAAAAPPPGGNRSGKSSPSAVAQHAPDDAGAEALALPYRAAARGELLETDASRSPSLQPTSSDDVRADSAALPGAGEGLGVSLGLASDDDGVKTEGMYSVDGSLGGGEDVALPDDDFAAPDFPLVRPVRMQCVPRVGPVCRNSLGACGVCLNKTIKGLVQDGPPLYGTLQELPEHGTGEPEGPPKPCALCGVVKQHDDFGPKKGAKDGKDCYCRICSTLRRRYTIPVRRSLHGTWSQTSAVRQQTAQPHSNDDVRTLRPRVTPAVSLLDMRRPAAP